MIAGYYLTTKLRAIGIPTVFDIADDLPEAIHTSPQIPNPVRPFAKFCGQLLLKKVMKQSAKITLITSVLKHSYEFPMDKTSILQNGVDVSLFHDQLSFSELSKNKGDFILGFVGAMTEWVELRPLFEAAKNLFNKGYPIRSVIIGQGLKSPEFQDEAQSIGISDRINFMGWVATEDLPKQIALMDVCLICRKDTPDSQNSFPLKLLEYMACGKPVISVRLKGVVEAVQDRVLYANDSEELEQRIIELYNDPDKRERLGREGMKFVRENFSWDRICKDFEKVLYEAKNEAA